MKVWPTSDVMRKHLKHPHRQVGFRDEGPIDWPDDAFTHRRIMDGDVTTEEPVVAMTPIFISESKTEMEPPTAEELAEPISMQAEDSTTIRKKPKSK